MNILGDLYNGGKTAVGGIATTGADAVSGIYHGGKTVVGGIATGSVDAVSGIYHGGVGAVSGIYNGGKTALGLSSDAGVSVSQTGQSAAQVSAGQTGQIQQSIYSMPLDQICAQQSQSQQTQQTQQTQQSPQAATTDATKAPYSIGSTSSYCMLALAAIVIALLVSGKGKDVIKSIRGAASKGVDTISSVTHIF